MLLYLLITVKEITPSIFFHSLSRLNSHRHMKFLSLHFFFFFASFLAYGEIFFSEIFVVDDVFVHDVNCMMQTPKFGAEMRTSMT